MSNYSQTVFFGPKDSLPLGNPSKLILGTDVDTELANIATAITSKFDSSSIAAGPIGFAAGTVSLPSLYLGPDTTTGLYRSAVNQLSVAVSGVNALTVASTGATVANTLTVNGAGTGLSVANNATVGGALTVSTGGSSMTGQLTISAPATAVAALSVTSAASAFAAQFTGPSGANSAVQLVDGNTGNHKWSVRSGFPATGFFGIRDDSAGVTALQIDTSQIVSVVDDGGTMQSVGYRGTPQTGQTANYTLQLSDRGKMVKVTGTAGQTITVPSGVFSAGDVVTIAAFNGTNAYTIAAGVSLSLFWGTGTNTTGNRTLTSVGIATIVFTDGSHAIIVGSGLS